MKVIGLIPLYDDEKDSIWMVPGYLELIEKAGGLPLILPFTEDTDELDQAIAMCDGFLFTGGHDVDPTLYKEKKLETCGMTCNVRDTMESYILYKAIKLDKPILGICRGIQFINASLGGTLYQDLPTEHPSDTEHHMSAPYDETIHSVDVIEDTLLAEIIGSGEYKVNSYHHQAIKSLAPNAIPMAISEDFLIEAIQIRGPKFVVAVQWHPEFIFEKDEKSLKLAKAFIEAC